MNSVYAPPEGFKLDPNSRLYYRDDGTGIDNGVPVRHITWFYPNTGEYRQDSHPIEQSVESPAEQPVETPIEQPPQSVQIPEGFTFDPGRSQYYAVTSANDPKTGAASYMYTFFDPATGKYSQEFYPLNSQANPQTKSVNGQKQRKLPALLLIVPPLAAIAVLFLLWYIGMLPFLPDINQSATEASSDTVNTVSNEGVTVTLDKNNYFPGESIQVTVEGITQEMADNYAVISIYVQGQPHDAYMEYMYPYVETDTFTFTAPNPGNYEMRLFEEDFYIYTDERLILTIPFTVEDNLPETQEY